MKKLFMFVLVFATISLLLGQDLNYQLNVINEKYDINIQDSTTKTLKDIFGFDPFHPLKSLGFDDSEVFYDE